jgi:hypothetical protein
MRPRSTVSRSTGAPGRRPATRPSLPHPESIDAVSDAVPADVPARWFEYWRRASGTRDERKALEQGRPIEVQAAHDWIEKRIMSGGVAAIDAIAEIAEAASNPDEEAIVGIGPIEDLIHCHGDAVVDLLVERARRIPALARTLRYVSVSSGGISATSMKVLERYLRKR